MRILEETEISYNLDDIADAIDSELGFSMIKRSPTKGYFMLGNDIVVNFGFDSEGEVDLTVKFPSKEVDVSENISKLEMYATAIESVFQIRDIISNMTGGQDEDII